MASNPMPQGVQQPPAPPNEADRMRATLEAALQENARLKEALVAKQAEENANVPLDQLPPEQALQVLRQDPVGFVQTLIEKSAGEYLVNMKEQAELRGALNAARKTHPELERFEGFVMQEVARMIQEDPDGHIGPWDELIEKGVEAFRKKFQETLKESPEMGPQLSADETPFVEGQANRVKQAPPPSYTRAQIAGMSQAEFLKNEAAINEALRGNRIR